MASPKKTSTQSHDGSMGRTVYLPIHENRKNQPFMQVNTPYMDGMGMSVQRFVVWVCLCLD